MMAVGTILAQMSCAVAANLEKFFVSVADFISLSRWKLDVF
jgi:hypothetical protein